MPVERIDVQDPGILHEQVRDLVLGYDDEIAFHRHQLAERHLAGIRGIRELYGHCKPRCIRAVTPPWQAWGRTDRIFTRARIKAERDNRGAGSSGRRLTWCWRA